MHARVVMDVQVDKMGEWIAPEEVMTGGSPHLHAVQSGDTDPIVM